MKKRAWILLVSLSLLVFAFAGCAGDTVKQQATGGKASGQKVKKLRVGFPGAGQAAIGDLSQIAEEQGYFREELAAFVESYELIPFSGSGPAINEAFASNALEMAIYGDTPNVTLKSKGIDTTVVGIGNAALDAAFVVPAGSPVKTIAELKGKKVATGKGTFMHRTLGEGLASAGLKQSDVQFFQMNTTEAQNAIQTNQIDATVITTTLALKLVETKTGTILADGSKHPEWKGLNVMVARTDFAKENPKVVIAYLKALHRAWEFAGKNPQEVKKSWAKASGVSLASFDYQYPDQKLADYFSPDPNSQIVKRLEYTKKFLLDNQLITKDFDVNKWFDRSYYQEAIKK
jgi:sulfonate transport system substrate-binding protein